MASQCLSRCPPHMVWSLDPIRDSAVSVPVKFAAVDPRTYSGVMVLTRTLVILPAKVNGAV